MNEKTIKGTSISVINDFILVIDKHIESKTFFVRKSSVNKSMGKNNYYTHMTVRSDKKCEENKLFFIHQDVIIRLLLLDEVFPDLFEDLKLRPASNCREIVVEKEDVNLIVKTIKVKIDLINSIISSISY